MQLDFEPNTRPTAISAYSERGIQIAGHWYTDHLLLTPGRVVTGWQACPVSELTREHLTLLSAENPEVLILGTGNAIRFPPQRLFADLAANGVGLEVMDTRAACRTFNILLSEERAVAALLYLEIKASQ